MTRGLTRREVLGGRVPAARHDTLRPDPSPAAAALRRSAPGATDILVVIFLRGGADCLNMVVPCGDGGHYYGRRGATGIPEPSTTGTPCALDLDGYFGLHPALGAPDMGDWLRWYESKTLAIVHAAHMDDPGHTRSHFDAMDGMERGTPGEKKLQSGYLGRYLATTFDEGDSPLRAVGIGTMLQASLRGAPVPAVVLQTVAGFRLQGRATEVDSFGRHLEQLYEGTDWLQIEGRSAFAALHLIEDKIGGAAYVPENGARYTTGDGFHSALQQVAQLIKSGVGLQVACVDIGGWDTHANQVRAEDPTTGAMADLMRRLATGVSAFLVDMDAYLGDGTGPGVTVVTMSEFGRRADENASFGTDHGHGSAMFVFGRCVDGGRVYANPWPTLAEDDLDNGDLRGTTEYRDVLWEILARRMGATDLATIFPGHTARFPGLVKPLVAPPTATPTATAPATATATPDASATITPTPGTSNRVYVPWLEKP